MRKPISFFAAVMIFFVSLNLTACNRSTEAFITKGEWLHNINIAFGMLKIAQTDPINKNISASDTYYNDVQIAAAWSVVAPDEKIKTDDFVTKQYAVNTLSNAGTFSPFDSSNKEKVEAALNSGFISDKKALKSKLDATELNEMLDKAKSAWANRTVEIPYSETKLADGVKDLGAGNNALDYVVNGNQITIKNGSGMDLKANDIFTLPSTDKNFGGSAHRVESVRQSGSDLVITVSNNEPQLSDVAETLITRETFTPNFLNGATIYDGNGNPITPSASNMRTGGIDPPVVGTLGYNKSTSQPEKKSLETTEGQLFKTVSLGFEYDGWSIEGSISSDSVSFSIAKELSKSTSKGLKTTNKVFSEIEFYNPVVTIDQNWSWFELQSIMLKVDYKTKISAGVKSSYDATVLKVAPFNNGNGNIISNFKKIGVHEGSTAGAEKIKICKLPIPAANLGPVGLWLEINIDVKITGEITVIATISGAKGIDYRNGNARYIAENDVDLDVKVQAKIEPTLEIAINVGAWNFNIAGASLNAGVGLKIELVTHVADIEKHLIEQGDLGEGNAGMAMAAAASGAEATVEYIKQIAAAQGGTYEPALPAGAMVPLTFDMCFDVTLYPIVEIGISSDSLLYGLLNHIGFDATFRIIGEEQYILKTHIESFEDLLSQLSGQSPTKTECSKEYTPFSGEQTNASTTQSIDDSGTIEISSYYASLKVGDTYSLTVAKLPDGYSQGDIRYESDKNDIVTVDQNGNIKAVSNGSATVKVFTSDGKKKAFCGVFVE